MNHIDPHTAARVWERVKSPPVNTEADTIRSLMIEELLDALTYQRLAKKLPPAQGLIARQLAQQEQSHAVCLKGIYTMLTGNTPNLTPPTPQDDPPQVILRRCYGREMRCLAQYEARQTDPQYGHIFHRLAREEQEHCRKLLELLGMLTK